MRKVVFIIGTLARHTRGCRLWLAWPTPSWQLLRRYPPARQAPPSQLISPTPNRLLPMSRAILYGQKSQAQPPTASTP